MKLLFLHQNFPGQFKHLAPALAAQGHTVVAMTMQQVAATTWQGVTLVSYRAHRGTTPNVHPWVADFETKVIRAEACFRAALQLKAQGFAPDAIIAHPGWGESLFVKEVWPEAKLGIYCEFFYHPHGADVGFDPEFPSTDPGGEPCRLRLKNLNNLLHFEVSDAGISHTQWQASTFPEPFRSKITVVHDGIDTATIAPNPKVSITLTTQNGRAGPSDPRRRGDHLRQPQPRALPRLPHLLASAARNPQTPSEGAGLDRRRQRRELRRQTRSATLRRPHHVV